MSLKGSVKLEPEWESEAATAPLFYAVKEELDLGPELLQPPDMVYALQDIVKKEPTAHKQAAPGLTCSVVLEPMLVDLNTQTCTVGLQTYNFQLHYENQESLEISLEQYEIKEDVKTEEDENENTSHQDILSNADIREISSVNLASCTEIAKLGSEQKTVYEFVTQSINDCKFCSHTFDTKLLLQEHEKSQHGVKYFTCSTFTENGNLKVELNTINKLYECKTTFATSSNLGDHLGTHTGENNEAALVALYEDHAVKQELVLGPELLHKPSVVYTPPASVRGSSLEAACVKPEQGWDSDGHSETEDHELKGELVDEDLELGSVVLKEELELGPVVLQPPDALYTRRGQARLLAAKRTKSAKPINPKAPVEEKKAKTSEKIAKCNSAEMIQKPSVIQEVFPEKPAVSSSSSEVNTLSAETNCKCEKCGKGFNNKSDLEKHLNTHMLMKASTSHKASKFTCKTCNCTFDTKLLLQEHEKSRHGVKYFACDECEYATKHASNLKCHLRTHNGEKPFKCSQCKSAFTHRRNLRAHLRTHTGEKPFKCSQCKSVFTLRQNLHTHLRTHTGEKPFKCCQCSSAFSRSSHLQYHLRTHTGEKPFKCSQCSSAYSQIGHLQNHLRTHTGEKPFKCRQCSSAFSRSHHLQYHLRTHTVEIEKPFKCGKCSSAFTLNAHLQVHLRTHTGEKPFECNICDYKTTRSGNLKDHLMSRHSGQKPFGCDACSYRGATRRLLRKHMKRCHK